MVIASTSPECASRVIADPLFAGIAPVEAPRYVTVVVIDEPSGDLYGGGSAAAPVYSRITREVLRLQHAMPAEAYAGQDETEVADGSV